MENKYFTPDITDIRVGYECELYMSEDIKNDGDVWVYTLNPEKSWQVFKFTSGSDLMWFTPYILREQLRTPYLTKEQIEAEGWDVIGVYPNGATLHKKGKYELMFLQDCRLTITRVWKSFEGEPDEKTHRKDIYNGGVKCINDFRYITKLLGI